MSCSAMRKESFGTANTDRVAAASDPETFLASLDAPAVATLVRAPIRYWVAQQEADRLRADADTAWLDPES